MVKGLYTAYSGLTVQQKRLDVVSNNLANATTTGYKKEGLTTQSFKDVYGIKVKSEYRNSESWSEGRRILQKLGSGLFPEHGQYI